jgi:hypothetical protein
MIRLLRNVTFKSGPRYAGDDISDLPEDIIADSLDNGLAEEVDAEVTGKLVGTVDDDGNISELDEWKVPELKRLAKALEIEGSDQMKKADLLVAIKAIDFDLSEYLAGDDE